MDHIIAQVMEAFSNSPTALADAIGNGVKRQSIEHWMRVGSIPSVHWPAIERVMRGKVTVEQMARASKSTRWVRIPDEAWPWHPKGRPLLDVARMAA